MTDIAKIRNIGIIAHIDAGKTTTTERILYCTGREHKMGDVDDGTTITDWMPEERSKGITITSATITCTWKDHAVTIIDTPGHIDFTAEVERSLRVLDGAVGIFCAVGGVEAQSETVWRQANRYRVPRIAFINKMDRVGANFEAALSAMRARLNANPVVTVMPWGQEQSFRGVIDVVSMKAYIFDEKSKGKEFQELDIPKDMLPQARKYREELVDRLADFDDEIIAKFSDGNIEEQDLRRAIRRGTLDNRITPVLAGASLRYKGVQLLLDAIVDFLPSPADVPPIKGFHPDTGAEILRAFDSPHLCALAFKSMSTKHGDITSVRVYSGKLEEGMQVYNSVREKTERINRLWTLYSNHLIKCEQAGPGDIVGIVGFRYTITGDTLCKKSQPIVLEKMHFPETVISKVVEPKVQADKEQLLKALQCLSKDDPTFAYKVDEESGQTLICGMGELHLDIIYSRIQNEYRTPVNLGRPRVSYRETVAAKADGACLFQKQFGGKEHYAYVKVRVEPWKENALNVKTLPPETLPKLFYNSIEEGLKSAMSSGDLAGYPLINIRITLLEAQSHATNSTEIAFNKAAFEALKDAMKKAGHVLLEPIMRLEVHTPLGYMGDVLNNLHVRRATVEEMELQGDIQVIRGYAPLAEMFGYANELRSVSQGRATYSMEPCKYAAVPEEIQARFAEAWDCGGQG